MSDPRVYFPLNEVANIRKFPLGDILDDSVLKHIWITGPWLDTTTGEGVVGVLVNEAISFRYPGIPWLELALGSQLGAVNADIRAHFQPKPHFDIELPLTLRVDGTVLKPLKAGTDQPDTGKKTLDIELGRVRIGIDIDGNFTLDIPSGLTLPRCIIGSTGVILSATNVRWLSPASSSLPSTVTPGFSGLHIEGATIELSNMPIKPGRITMNDVYLGTGGFSGWIAWIDSTLTWSSTGGFSGAAAGEPFGFQGAITKIELVFKQNALTSCEIEGNIFMPYLERIIGLSLGFDGNGSLTAIAGHQHFNWLSQSMLPQQVPQATF